MSLIRVKSFGRVAVAYVAITLTMTACGGDSTGPSTLDARAALQSLSLGLGALGEAGPGDAETLNSSFDAIVPVLDQINVTIGGRSQTMFALGFRESFPEGTCFETLFPDPYDIPGSCHSPNEFGLLLWQSHSASAPPDRMIVISGDVGTINFTDSFFTEISSGSEASLPDGIPGFAVYLEGEDNLWTSISGTLTTDVVATNQSCGVPLPPYAKTGTCSISAFDEQGSITFESLSDTDLNPRHTSLTIPRQTIHGLWVSITETQPFTLPGAQPPSRLFGR
jgi:hypothetical protein